MGTTNTQSLREEAERIKAEFARLSVNKKISHEAEMLFGSMLMLINLLVAIFLERTTKKDNKNSSKPSSQTDKDETSTTNKVTNGKGKEETDAIASNTRTVESIRISKVTKCDICGNDLRKIACKHLERRTKIDIIFEKTVEHIDAEVKVCPDCDSVVKGKFPIELPGPLQYGNELKSYVVNLLICQMVSLNRVQKLVKTIIREVIAQATLLTSVPVKQIVDYYPYFLSPLFSPILLLRLKVSFLCKCKL